MNLINGLFKSSLGKKLIMALTGCALFLFVIAHLLGNLQVFLGPDVINAYGHFLQSKPELVWAARLGLLLMVGLHVWSAVALSAENKAARPQGYMNDPKPVVATYASRTMLMSGLIVGAFILYHLLHFTVKTPGINLVKDPALRDFAQLKVPAVDMVSKATTHDVYRMMVTGFQVPLVSGFYLLAMALLCLHLSHGVSAMFQSVGLKNKAWGPRIDCFAKIAAGAIFLGYASIPLAVLFGILK
jgi:succinate dehydrogenase / fumarate reductase cytochrome b subunit